MKVYEQVWGVPLLGIPLALRRAFLAELSTAICETFSNEVPDPLHWCQALRRHCRLRCVNSLCSLFPGPPAYSLATLVALARGKTVSGPVEAEYREFVSLVAAALWARHKNRLTPTHCFNTRAMLWNLTAFAPPIDSPSPATGSEAYNTKLRHIVAALKRGPVLILESKWKAEHAGRYVQSLPGVFIASTPAVQGQSGGASGGVAIIAPTHQRVAANKKHRRKGCS